MYFDLIFPYRIDKEAKVATDKDGNGADAYMQMLMRKCKSTLTEEKYNDLHEKMRYDFAKVLDTKPEWVVPISGEEYEKNAYDEKEEEADLKIIEE